MFRVPVIVGAFLAATVDAGCGDADPSLDGAPNHAMDASEDAGGPDAACDVDGSLEDARAGEGGSDRRCSLQGGIEEALDGASVLDCGHVAANATAQEALTAQGCALEAKAHETPFVVSFDEESDDSFVSGAYVWKGEDSSVVRVGYDSDRSGAGRSDAAYVGLFVCASFGATPDCEPRKYSLCLSCTTGSSEPFCEGGKVVRTQP
jgi:hypothetical protein